MDPHIIRRCHDTFCHGLAQLSPSTRACALEVPCGLCTAPECLQSVPRPSLGFRSPCDSSRSAGTTKRLSVAGVSTPRLSRFPPAPEPKVKAMAQAASPPFSAAAAAHRAAGKEGADDSPALDSASPPRPARRARNRTRPARPPEDAPTSRRTAARSRPGDEHLLRARADPLLPPRAVTWMQSGAMAHWETPARPKWEAFMTTSPTRGLSAPEARRLGK